MFKPATKEKAKLKAAFTGPTGSGKTYSALAVATAIGKKIAVIDTEHGSASKYSHIFKFDDLKLTNHHPVRYIEAIKAAGAAGYDVLIIDSLSHAWMGNDGCLELVDKAAAASRSGNTFNAWGKVTPLHNDLIEAMLAVPCHVIATMRVKMHWLVEQNDKGKSTPRKVGLDPVQRDGMTYEFDVILDFDQSHDAVVSKTRIPDLDSLVINRPGKEFAEMCVNWLNDGVEPQPPTQQVLPNNVTISASTSTEGKSATTVESTKAATLGEQESASSAANSGDSTAGQDGSAATAKTSNQPAPAPDNDEIASAEIWAKVQAAGMPNGWLTPDILRLAANMFRLTVGEVKAKVTVNQARSLREHVLAHQCPEKVEAAS